MLGYDIHPEYQRGIRLDLGKTQQGAGFVWIKVADGGRAYVSPGGYTPGAQAGAAHVAGLPAGGYSYAQPGDGGAHADVLLGECSRWQLTGLAPVTDIEDNPKIHTWSTSEAVSYGRAFCARVRAHGVRPGVYMSASKMQACRPDQWPENPVIWCARYGARPEGDPARGVKALYTGRYDVHQFSSSGGVPGSAGLVDLNESYTTALFTSANQGDGMADEETLIILEQLTGSRTVAADHVFPGWAVQAPKPGAKALTLVDYARQTYAELKATQATLAALAAAVAAATNEPDITVAALTQIVNDAVRENIEIKGTVEITGKAATP